MSQLALAMDLPALYAPEQFVVSPANAQAYSAITRWPDWPHHALYLHGERGAGKTHLAHIWQRKSSAMFVPPDTMVATSQPLIIDGLEEWCDSSVLFHLLNHCLLQSQPLLVIAQTPPDGLSITLPDVVSRLKMMPQAAITTPDDALLEAVLYKQLADRQLKISSEVIAYILPRLSRSFAGVSDIVSRLDNASLSAQRTLTIPFIKQTLEW